MLTQLDQASMDAFQDQLPRSLVTEQRVHQQILHACQSVYDRFFTLQILLNKVFLKRGLETYSRSLWFFFVIAIVFGYK